MFMIGPACGIILLMIILCASNAAAVRKINARGLGMGRILEEWNTKCFYPASYSLAAGSMNAYFILTYNDNGPANVVNILPTRPAMGGYPGIPSGYAPG